MLSPYTVLDLTDDRGELASMILGDLGADVIKVEPPEGSSSRRLGPFIEGAPEPERSLNFFAYNRNKRGVTLDLETDAGRDSLRGLAARADFLFESAPPGAMAKLGLDFDALRKVNPRLVYVSISPYGQDGPYAGHAASDLTLCAMGGHIILQGEADRPPVRITVPQAWLHTATEAAVAALIAHSITLQTGQGQYIDVSAQAAVVWMTMQAMVASAIQGEDFNRAGATMQLGTMALPICFPCADGYMVVLNNGRTLAKTVPWWVEEGIVPPEWLDGEEWVTWDIRFLQGQSVRYTFPEIMAAAQQWLLKHTKKELLERGLSVGVTNAPVNTIEDLARFRHLQERDYWITAPLPGGRQVQVPGLFLKLSETPMSVRRWAPKLGEHNEEILGAKTESAVPVPPYAGRTNGARTQALPFEGLKVADFSWAWAGPIATKYLADHGATVVRVETENPPDRVRTMGPYKDKIAGANRSQAFGDGNTSKLDITLDLKNPSGIAVARKLIAWADVCVENFTVGTMDSLGIGYDAARTLNPSIIMASSCMMGQTGPARDFAGFGYHAAAIAGFFDLTGWPDRGPAGAWSAYTDIVAPRFLVAAIMSALDHRRRTGQGQYIDISQMESALLYLAPQLIDYNLTGHAVTRNGNRSETAAPHNAYPCAGEDQWCAIVVETDEQWQALRRVIDDPDWARDERFAGAAGRLASQDEIDARLGEWTRERSPYEVMRLLQAAGVPAGVAQRSSDLLKDPQLSHRGFHRYMEHPEMGNVPYTGHEFRIRGYDSGPRFPAPLLGQHNEQVMREILGMTDDEIMETLAAGALV
jgi:crotonobetainyl-CoA:carnitine CoA-transferase CaiB-like acyl-CoA transferase